MAISEVGLRLWHVLPEKTRHTIFYRILLPLVRRLLRSMSRGKRDRLFQGEIALSPEILGLEDWHDLEFDGHTAFRWSKRVSGLFVNPRAKTGLLAMRLGYPEHLKPPTVIVEGLSSHELAIRRGWDTYFVPVAPIPDGTPQIRIRVEHVSDSTGHTGERGIMASEIRILPLALAPADLVGATSNVAQNRMTNDVEWKQGQVKLSTFPPHLRIDLETRCNISPPCAYCGFNAVKDVEKQTDYQFSPLLLREMGSFFDNAETVLDCSYGEPLLSGDLRETVELTETCGKRFDFTTNGQLLGSNIQDALLGKNIIVHVSLDASSSALYSLYRNDKFDVVIDNIASLCRKKRGYHNLPHVIVSHLAMRSNVGHFEEFAALMQHVGVDAIKIRTLAVDPLTQGDVVERDARGFDYSREILELQEFRDFVEKARACTERRGLQFLNDLDFGIFPLGRTPVPICEEPWKTLYFFRRGVFPCCFGNLPLFAPDRRGDMPLDRFLAHVWNSEPFQEIRAHLARGELSPYCRESPSCLVVKRKRQQESAHASPQARSTSGGR